MLCENKQLGARFLALVVLSLPVLSLFLDKTVQVGGAPTRALHQSTPGRSPNLCAYGPSLTSFRYTLVTSPIIGHAIAAQVPIRVVHDGVCGSKVLVSKSLMSYQVVRYHTQVYARILARARPSPNVGAKGSAVEVNSLGAQGSPKSTTVVTSYRY